DTASEERTQIGGAQTTPVNISADGSSVYFVSPLQLDGLAGKAGAPNLYAWDGTGLRFIATVDPLDVEGATVDNALQGGLGLRVGAAVTPTLNGKATRAFSRLLGPAADPSRTTPDGSVLIFESHADLTGYGSGGHPEVYRYEADGATAGERLRCVSC